jgi:hypothetical protein
MFAVRFVASGLAKGDATGRSSNETDHCDPKSESYERQINEQELLVFAEDLAGDAVQQTSDSEQHEIG